MGAYRRLMVLAVITATLVLALTLPSSAQSGCELAHECFADVAKWYPPGWPEDRLSLVAWNPNTGGYGAMGGYDLAALCYNHGGYYYLDYGGVYWNAC